MLIRVLSKCLIILLFFVSTSALAANQLIIKAKNNLRFKQFNTSSVFSQPEIINIREFNLMPNQPINSKLVDDERTYIITLDDQADLETILQRANQSSEIVYVEPVYPVEVFSIPNDPYFTNQYYLTEKGYQNIVDLESKDNVLVAVIDTGVDVRHLDLEQAIYINENDPVNGMDDDNNGVVDDYNGVSFQGYSENIEASSSIDQHGHGTHIAGIIAAQKNNQEGITGFNDRAKILNIRFLDEYGRGNQVDGAAAIIYAVNAGAKIINCSWGYFKKNTILEEAIQYALDRNVIVVAAIGNSNTTLKEYPSAFEGVIAVGSIDKKEQRSFYTSFGDHLDFLMYGEDLISPIINDQYDYKSGTSQAAAILTGVISKLLSVDSSLSKTEIMNALIASSSNNGQKTLKEGYGIIDGNQIAKNLFPNQILPDGDNAESFSLSRVMNYPNPIRDQGTIFGFETDTENLNYTIRIFNLFGKLEKKIDGQTISGYNKVAWTPNNLFSGTYFYVVELHSNRTKKRKKGKLSIL